MDDKLKTGMIAAAIVGALSLLGLTAVLGLVVLPGLAAPPPSQAAKSGARPAPIPGPAAAAAPAPMPARPSAPADPTDLPKAPQAVGARALTRAEFRAAVRAFKNHAGQPWNGANGRGGRHGFVIKRPFGLPADIPVAGEGQTQLDSVAIFTAEDFRSRFGLPDRVRSERHADVWAWDCKDGVVEVILGPHAGTGKVRFVGIDDA